MCKIISIKGLGGTGIEQDETIYSPHKMQWEEAENLKHAALGGQVKTNEVVIMIDLKMFHIFSIRFS